MKKNNKYKMNLQKIVIIFLIVAMLATSVLALFA